ncbi:MAG: glycerol-3-phosphate 1-O-acyltransferase PlsY [Candidatus Heimdallarchaeota archaeon]
MAFEILYEILLVIIGYLFGSIPVAYLIGKIWYGIDIREHGSGNMGTANVLRVLGKKAGLITLAFDMLKGALALLCVRFYLWFGNYRGFETIRSETVFLEEGFLLALVAFMTILGHSYPVWLKFKGGKSAAVGAGALLGVNPIAFAIVMVVWFPLLKFTKLMSLSNLIVAWFSPPLYWFFAGTKWFDNRSWWAFGLSFIMIAFVYWRHRANIKRLIAGEERKMGEKADIKEQE